jgi:hypothetical protein
MVSSSLEELSREPFLHGQRARCSAARLARTAQPHDEGEGARNQSVRMRRLPVARACDARDVLPDIEPTTQQPS